MDLWRVEMLGGLRVCFGARAVPRFRSRRTASILAYLAYRRNQPQSRDRVAEVFWPDSSLDLARHSLSTALSDLRRQLAEVVPDAPPLLDTDRYHLSLSDAAGPTDVDDFLMEFRRAQRAPPSEQGSLYRLAADRYSGELLRDMYDDWVQLEQQKLLSAFLESVHNGARALRCGGHVEAAFSLVERGVDLHPEEESLCELAMRLHLDQRRPAAALRVFRRLEQAAGRDGDPPPKALSALVSLAHAELRQGSPESHVSQAPVRTASVVVREPAGGAMAPQSPYYLIRPADGEIAAAVERGDSLILVKGSRQMGKTSLVGRALQEARRGGCRTACTDFQALSPRDLSDFEALLRALCESLADQLELEIRPGDDWDAARGPALSFRRFLRRAALASGITTLVWALDEVDRLFTQPYGSEVFGLLRSLHNERALNPEGHWSRLTMIISYASEAQLFITDLNQSPFNVGTRIQLDDFSREQVAHLNHLHGDPLKEDRDLDTVWRWIGGQPYLTRRALQDFVAGVFTLDEWVDAAARDDGPFGEHLRRLWVALDRDEALSGVMRSLIIDHCKPDDFSFYRLRAGGLLRGDCPERARVRCPLYETYLRKRLHAPHP